MQPTQQPFKSSPVSYRDLGYNPFMWLAFGFGSGLSPKAPGTAGTAAALPLAWGLMHIPTLEKWALLLVATVFGVSVCGYACRRLQQHDPGGVVWDEFVGLGFSVVWFAPSVLILGLGFVWFRVFDVLKPWPISWLDQHVSGGLGVMLDDILAGLMAAIAMWVTLLILP